MDFDHKFVKKKKSPLVKNRTDEVIWRKKIGICKKILQNTDGICFWVLEQWVLLDFLLICVPNSPKKGKSGFFVSICFISHKKAFALSVKRTFLFPWEGTWSSTHRPCGFSEAS